MDNPLVPDSASRSGRLLGLTSASEPVGGAATLRGDLASLGGELVFTALEAWGAHAAPSPVGPGARWQDGALRYAVDVTGNRFTNHDAEADRVTGTFFGRAHAAMGGVLERPDLVCGDGEPPAFRVQGATAGHPDTIEPMRCPH